ncbi:MAG: hypothetical protein QMD46_03420 [Methanomicrobiales archaeon]|nr:hypothetical protein [Methanomicrobiales archaeon]MDI6876022.1 hypothetical protein [Methanomicrobiales archaeon]
MAGIVEDLASTIVQRIESMDGLDPELEQACADIAKMCDVIDRDLELILSTLW